ncbi:hypothetical protein ACWDOR_28425 [Streptosporangium canum]|uniref:hypothetical protein n=1 Tax=Streptosporangium canum TaxID=324952 RepID=UPI00367C483B
MLSVLSSRRIAVTVAGAALISMTAACGGSANAETCASATKLMTDYGSATAANLADLEKYKAANQKLSEDLKALAGTADGDLATALNDLSTSMGSLKIDEKDPAAFAAAVPEFTKKLTEAGAKLQTTCA